jgi:hypothetical protein
MVVAAWLMAAAMAIHNTLAYIVSPEMPSKIMPLPFF